MYTCIVYACVCMYVNVYMYVYVYLHTVTATATTSLDVKGVELQLHAVAFVRHERPLTADAVGVGGRKVG